MIGFYTITNKNIVNVSFNELEMHAYRAMQARNIPDGVCTSIAESLVYLSALDFDVLETFLRFLFGSEGALFSPEIFAAVILENLSDTDKKSSIGMASEMAWFILPHLQRLTEECLEWRKYDEQSKIQYIALISPKKKFPDLIGYHKKNGENYVKKSSKHLAYFTNNLAQKFLISSDKFSKKYQLSLKNGLSIPQNEFEKICELGKKTLVKNNDNSYTDAGEAADFIDPEDKLVSTDVIR